MISSKRVKGQNGLTTVFLTSDAKSEMGEVRCSRIVRARNSYALFAASKLLKLVVARDGIEPPTPAFSGPPTESRKWFEINGSY